MGEAQELFDRILLAQRRNNVAASAGDHAFLLERVALDFADRLAGIKRTFPVGLNLGAFNGVLSRHLRSCERIGMLVDVELSVEMARQCDGPCVVADEEFLPFSDGTLDLVLSGLSLQLVNDLPGVLIQIFRSLKADGLLLASMLGGETLKELRHAWLIAEDEIYGGASPRVAPFANLRDVGSLLQRAGFALPVVDLDRVQVTYSSPLALMQELKGMGASNILNARLKKPVTRALLQRVCEVYHQCYGLDDGRVSATFDIVNMTAWVPHSSQQQPLKPGTAHARLADALGVKEMPAGEKARR